MRTVVDRTDSHQAYVATSTGNRCPGALRCLRKSIHRDEQRLLLATGQAFDLPVRAESNAAIRLQRECATIAEEVEESMEQVSVKNPAVLGGEPVFRGTRVQFNALTGYLEDGESLSEFWSSIRA